MVVYAGVTILPTGKDHVALIPDSSVSLSSQIATPSDKQCVRWTPVSITSENASIFIDNFNKKGLYLRFHNKNYYCRVFDHAHCFGLYWFIKEKFILYWKSVYFREYSISQKTTQMEPHGVCILSEKNFCYFWGLCYVRFLYTWDEWCTWARKHCMAMASKNNIARFAVSMQVYNIHERVFVCVCVSVHTVIMRLENL